MMSSIKKEETKRSLNLQECDWTNPWARLQCKAGVIYAGLLQLLPPWSPVTLARENMGAASYPSGHSPSLGCVERDVPSCEMHTVSGVKAIVLLWSLQRGLENSSFKIMHENFWLAYFRCLQNIPCIYSTQDQKNSFRRTHFLIAVNTN